MSAFKNTFSVVVVTTLLVLSCGCDRTYVAEDNSTKSTDADSTLASTSPDSTTSVSPDKPANLASPASTLAAQASTPEGVCGEFMNLLKAEKRIEAENLLTRMALTVTSKAGLQLEPMGGPNSVYKVNDVRYATTKQKLAQVECTIIDKTDGETVEMDLTWLVRKQSNGWRISGVMLEMQPGAAKDLLSFENIRDVTKIKNLADTDTLDDDSSRQANASEKTLK